MIPRLYWTVQSSIERSFVLLDIFAKLSGLKVNYEKTEALWIGSFKNRTDKLAINQNIKEYAEGQSPRSMVLD